MKNFLGSRKKVGSDENGPLGESVRMRHEIPEELAH
jgi:hypothetical protein